MWGMTSITATFVFGKALNTMRQPLLKAVTVRPQVPMKQWLKVEKSCSDSVLYAVLLCNRVDIS